MSVCKQLGKPCVLGEVSHSAGSLMQSCMLRLFPPLCSFANQVDVTYIYVWAIMRGLKRSEPLALLVRVLQFGRALGRNEGKRGAIAGIRNPYYGVVYKTVRNKVSNYENFGGASHSQPYSESYSSVANRYTHDPSATLQPATMRK